MLISSKESLNHNSLWEMACFPQLLNHSNLAFLPPSLLPGHRGLQRGPCFVVP